MNRLAHWWHHFLDPHCQQCKDDIDDSKVCQSCESLRHELALNHQLVNKLLDKIVEESKPEERVINPNPEPIIHRVPWAVRRQQMEQADRVLAQEKRKAEEVAANAPKPIVKADMPTEELEKELLEAKVEEVS